jgi:hypothetical protein
MKNLFITLLCVLSLISLSTQAQTKKTTKKPTTTSKATPAKKTTSATKPNTTKATTNSKTVEPAKAEEKLAAKPTNQAVKSNKNNAATTYYKAALGLKFIYGVSLTGKYFISEKSALEGIVRYNGAGGLGSNIAFSGLYEYHSEIKEIAGLRWYIGGGGHVNHFSWKDVDAPGVTTFGVVGTIGLEYKVKNLPLAVSADWQPAYIINHGAGFSAENGGIGIKYTF